MSCQTCNHAMQRLGLPEAPGHRTFWCPRCGTLREEKGYGWTDTAVPTWIVRRTVLDHDGEFTREKPSRE